MLALDKIRSMLADRRLDIVATATGIHRNTISRIRDGQIRNPSYETAQKLSEYLTEAEDGA